MQKDDAVYLGHMLEKACQAITLLKGKTRDEYDRDEVLRLALAHVLQIIGEAARQVSPAGRAAHPELPWKEMMGMRHRIVHNYMDIDEDVLWETVQQDLEPLVAQLQSILPGEDINS